MKNKRNLIGLLVIIVAVTSVILISGCIQEKPEKEWKLSSDKYVFSDNFNKYVFIDHHTNIDGELIEGDYMGPMIDFPTYSYDEKTGTLRGMINFDIKDTLKVVYGSGTSLSGVAGSGAGTGLSGVYELPYEEYEFKILKIDSDGTAYLEYDNISIVLKSGEEWVNTSSRIDTQPRGKAKLTTTDKIINYGILEKSKIVK